jgi:6-phosphogluconolactonase
MKTRLLAALLAGLAATSVSPAATRNTTVVYVANGGSKDISIFHLDPAAGALTARGTVALDGAPGPLALSPDRRFLFAALRPSKSVQTLRVDATSGALTSLGTVETGVNAAYLITDRRGRHLLAADYGGDRITVHPVAADGTVGRTPTADLSTGRNPHSIMADAANRFVFVPLCGADQVLQFRFRDGRLEPNTPPAVAFRAVDGPRHFAFHPKADFVYVVNEKSSSVTALNFDRRRGVLTPVQTLTTLPADFTGRNTCADIHVTPDGKFLYASNRGHDSLAGYAIDRRSGRLTPLGHFATEKTPREFDVDPAGRFLFAAGQASDRLAAYRIEADGRLTPLKTYDVGKGPAWVLAVELKP